MTAHGQKTKKKRVDARLVLALPTKLKVRVLTRNYNGDMHRPAKYSDFLVACCWSTATGLYLNAQINATFTLAGAQTCYNPA